VLGYVATQRGNEMLRGEGGLGTGMAVCLVLAWLLQPCVRSRLT
jgi:hypothetical protein